MIGGSVVLFGKNRDSEIGLWLPNCTRCARTILLTTANFRTQFFPNSTTDPPITYTNRGICAHAIQVWTLKSNWLGKYGLNIYKSSKMVKFWTLNGIIRSLLQATELEQSLQETLDYMAYLTWIRVLKSN